MYAFNTNISRTAIVNHDLLRCVRNSFQELNVHITFLSKLYIKGEC